MDFFSFTLLLPFVATNIVDVITRGPTCAWLWGLLGDLTPGCDGENLPVIPAEGCALLYWRCSPGLRGPGHALTHHSVLLLAKDPTPADDVYTYLLQRARNYSAREHTELSNQAMPGIGGGHQELTCKWMLAKQPLKASEPS